jgi:hypothetical protein
MDKPLDFCGYIFHRNSKPVTAHNKGYTTIRKTTVADAKCCNSDKSWASYFGMLKHGDTWSLMCKIEKTMKLKELTRKIKIDRRMDAKNILPKDLIGETISICDYEIRTDSKGNANWIKCLIGMEEKTKMVSQRAGCWQESFMETFRGLFNTSCYVRRLSVRKTFFLWRM